MLEAFLNPAGMDSFYVTIVQVFKASFYWANFILSVLIIIGILACFLDWLYGLLKVHFQNRKKDR